ncbi:MAG TPA: 3',5'-cyclic-nucleotide phosphodiesterase [Gammaproteobacteria bacterium]|nr:3',5'-cyclic-nucleotide phosphodiesterase [Gammaproteobacteria bacterium]
MELKVLGCSGGIGRGHRTTSLLVDDDVLIDAGSGVGDLDLSQMAAIRHVFLTHSHLDHIAFIPFMLDSVFDRVGQALTVHGLPETIKALQQHIFNWRIWPDFSVLPSADRPVLRYAPMEAGQGVELKGRRFEMIPVAHAVPAVGYRVSSPGGAFAFSGDTSTNDAFWDALNAAAGLDVLIVETAFSNAELKLCHLAKHYCPSLLAADMKKLRHRPAVCITHNKPGEEETILAEIRAALPDWPSLRRLSGGEVFYF